MQKDKTTSLDFDYDFSRTVRCWMSRRRGRTSQQRLVRTQVLPTLSSKVPPTLSSILSEKKRRCRHKQHVGCCQGGGGRPPWCHMARALRCFFCNNSLFPSPAVLTRNVSRQQGRGNVALAAITRLGRELAKNVGKEEVDLHSPPEAALLFAMHCICKG